FRDDALDLGGVGYVEAPSVRASAAGGDLFDDARDARFVDVGDRDERAFIRKQVGGGAAHPAGGAGDEHGAALHRTVESLDWVHCNSPCRANSLTIDELSHPVIVGVV